MYRSAGRTPGDDAVENFQKGAEFRFDDGRIYRVVKQRDAIYHHELLLDNEGEIIYDEAARIDFFFGSGARGKSYAVNRGGLLFQSPISWYSRDQKWGMSPGYSYRQARFGRRISEGCVQCHAGRPSQDESRDNYFPEPVLIEAAIGCERCHGPGEEHLEFHKSRKLTRENDPIVNPARLEPDRREAVCYQCHLIGEMRLPRYGRTFSDFRPGDRVDDVWATLVAAASVRGDGKTKAVSQVEQMRESTCFKQSGGHLGCVSCHDAHSLPADAAAHYRRRCLACHVEKGCSAPADKQSAPPAGNSCAHCHMPRLSAHDIAHASQTDHRVLREPKGHDTSPGAATEKLLVFDEPHTIMPGWEIERAKALAKVLKLRESGHVSQAVGDELVQTLTRTAEIASDDPQTWAALASIFELRKDEATARKHWQRVVALRPNDELALDALAGICQRARDYHAGLAFSDRLIELNPYRARAHMRRALMLAELGRWQEAIADAESALRVDPLDKSARQWLVEVYRREGNLEGSRRHADMLKRISSLPLSRG